MKENKNFSFRTQLILFGFCLVLIVGLPFLAIEIRRPWQALDQLVLQGKIIITNIESRFEKDDLARLNNFALNVGKIEKKHQETYLAMAFNQLMESDNLLSESETKRILRENDLPVANFEYSRLQEAQKFWQEQFFHDPGIIFLLRQYKDKLQQNIIAARSAGFIFNDNYVMVDDEKNLYFLLDGSTWYESTYPGQKYNVTANDCPYFRNYLKNGPGFDTDPAHYYLHILPKFNEDQWGTWFSVWYAVNNNGIWNNFSLDFDASSIKKMMLTLSGLIMGMAIAIIFLISLLTAKLSLYISKPIDNLVLGTEAVILGNYDHEVPKTGSLEFSKLIAFFNEMLKNLKERLNMKASLEKLLSQELADQVAKHGLVLGGQAVNITNLFTDFAGFSTVTMKMRPEEIVAMLNDYFSVLVPIIKKWGGFPDKYIGDAIVSIFGAPVALDNHAENAVCCAIEMQRKIRTFNDQRRLERKPILEMRIGLNSGDVIAGAIGSDLKLEYTSIGETTNLAQRMESMCQIGHILIAQATYEKIQGVFFDGVHIEASPQSLKVKGYDKPVLAYNIYVTDIEISKSGQGSEEFYSIKKVDRGLKHASDLSEEEKNSYIKIVHFEK
ncbi:hypothetical protein JW977_03070 [Candidatus Falkowbacteria bacterium]|nr:hypothetical protein [Candidatus Falkowbacteria bacterium]